MESFKALNISHCFIGNVSEISKIRNLESLSISLDYVEDATSIKEMKMLKELYIENMSFDGYYTDDFSFLEELNDLEVLRINYGKTKNLSFLKNLKNLNSLKLHSIKGLNDISQISNLNNLEYLSLVDIPLSDLSPYK